MFYLELVSTRQYGRSHVSYLTLLTCHPRAIADLHTAEPVYVQFRTACSLSTLKSNDHLGIHFHRRRAAFVPSITRLELELVELGTFDDRTWSGCNALGFARFNQLMYSWRTTAIRDKASRVPISIHPYNHRTRAEHLMS
jgi:hypothetical protein